MITNITSFMKYPPPKKLHTNFLAVKLFCLFPLQNNNEKFIKLYILNQSYYNNHIQQQNIYSYRVLAHLYYGLSAFYLQ